MSKKLCKFISLFLVFSILCSHLSIIAFARGNRIELEGDEDPPFTMDGYIHVGNTNDFISNNGGNFSAIEVVDSNGALSQDNSGQIFGTNAESASQLYDNFDKAWSSENTNEKGLNELMKYYGGTLVYMNWLTKNWWTDSDGYEQYSAITLPMNSDGSVTPIDEKEVEKILQNLDDMSSKILSDTNIYPDQTTWIKDNIGLFVPSSKSSVIGTGWASMIDSDLPEFGTFENKLRMIIHYYLEASVYLTIAKGEYEDGESEFEGYEDWSFEELRSHIGDWDAPFWEKYIPAQANLPLVTSPENGEEEDTEEDNDDLLNPPAMDVNITQTSTKEGAAKNLYANPKYTEAFNMYFDTYNFIYSLYVGRNQKGFADYKKGDEIFYGWHRDDNSTSGDNSDYMATWTSDTFNALYWARSFTNSNTTSPGNKNGVVDNIHVDDGVFGLLVRDGKIVDGQITVNGKPDLTDIGYVILAAGATYDPFVSLAGNDAWLSTVQGFLTQQEQKDDVAKIIQVALNTKKPLYVTDGSRNQWVSQDSIPEITAADYRYAYLEDLLQIDEDVTRAYITLKGSMTPSQVDGSTWEYVNKDPEINKDSTSNEVHVEDANEANTVATDATNETKPNSLVKTVTDWLRTSAAGKLFASDYQVTTPVLLTSGFKAKWWGSESVGYAAAVGGLTSVILENAALDAKDNDHIQNATKEQVFINGLGDIVLVDGTVILPAIANPCLYNYTSPSEVFSGVDEFLTSIKQSTDYLAYYPYTAAMMNHYPTARVTADGKLAVDSSNETNKYMLIFNESESQSWGLTTLYAKQIEKVTQGTGQASLAQLASIRSASFMANSFRVEDDENTSFSLMSVAHGDAGTTWKNWLFSGIGNWDKVDDRLSTNFITRGKAYNNEGMSFFPLHDDSPETREAYSKLAGPITTSALRYISDNDLSTGAKVDAGTFRIEDYIYDFIGEGLLGTQYASSLVKNAQVSYEQLVDDQAGRFLNFLIQIVDTAADTLGKIDGVLSIKGPYDNAFFNVIFNFIQEFYLLIAVVLLVITAAKFFKGHFNMLYVVFVGCLCIAGFEVYANWLPTLVPQVYNFAVNDAIENVVWNTTFYNAESYKDTYRNADNIDPASGKLQPYTGTITLYQLTNAEMRDVAARTGVDIDRIKKGTIVHLDQDAGIFVQGNLIKMSIDRLLVNNSMRGLYKSQWDLLGTEYTGTEELLIENIPEYNGNPYSIQLVQPIVSLEAYYTPYDHFERAFISQLNKFANYFMIERRMYTYGQGDLYKDAFMTSSYINSGLFTSPGDSSVLERSVNVDTITVDVNNLQDAFKNYDVTALVQDVQEAFNPQDDWLGIVKVFAEPDVGIQNSLWGYIMQSRNWYDKNWKMTDYGDEKLSDMIRYINNHTKIWVIKNLDNLDSMSDENAIKMISLYATTCFTHYVSEFGQWLYPNYINAVDIELKDVLYGSMVELRDKNFAYDGTVVNTVGLNIGVFGVIFLLFIILFSSIFIFVVTYMIPLLYASLGCIVIFKLINTEDKMGVVKGYTKVTLASAVLYFLFSLSLQLVSLSGYKWYSYMICMICLFFCNYFLFWIVLSVIQNFDELGNSTLTKNLIRGFDKLTRGSFNRLSANVANITNKQRTAITPRVAYQYGRGYSVDEYDRPHGRRSSVAGAYSAPDDYSAPTSYGAGSRASGYGRQDYYEDSLGASRSNRSDHTSRRRRGWRGRVND